MSPPSSGNRRLNRTPCKAKLWRSRNNGRPPGRPWRPMSSGDGRSRGDQSPLWGGSGSEDGRTSGCGGRAVFGLSCSASSASLVQVQAMSVRIERTLRVGARSAICRHSTARCLHSTGVIIDTQPNAHESLITTIRQLQPVFSGWPPARRNYLQTFESPYPTRRRDRAESSISSSSTNATSRPRCAPGKPHSGDSMPERQRGVQKPVDLHDRPVPTRRCVAAQIKRRARRSGDGGLSVRLKLSRFSARSRAAYRRI